VTKLTASRRILHLTVLAGAVGIVSLGFGWWVPAVALLPLSGLLVLALVEVLLPLPVSGARQIELGEQLLAGDETQVRIQVDKVFAPYNLYLDDGVPEGLQVDQETRRPFAAVSGLRAETSYKVTARRRGDHEFGSALLRRTSVLGLFDRYAEVPIPTKITVLPPSARDMRIRVRPRPPTRQGLPTRSMRRGPGDEFFALRYYLPGDSLGDVNWKASARMNRIITNEFLPDEPPRYVVYVDTRASGAEAGQEDVFERSLKLASILSEALLDARAHVGIVLLSFHSLFLVPGAGANQVRRLRQMIIDARPGYEASLHQLVTAGVSHLPARADAILITPNVYDATLGQAVSFLRARHGRCIVISPAFPEVQGDETEDVSQRAAAALLNAEQQAALTGIAYYADHVTQWPPDEPITVTMARLDLAGRIR
jgi:uncharacterized protein (DUF58 family)